jgi:hypothetical protein
MQQITLISILSFKCHLKWVIRGSKEVSTSFCSTYLACHVFVAGESVYSMDVVLLKGTCHEIFDIWFLSSNNPPWLGSCIQGESFSRIWLRIRPRLFDSDVNGIADPICHRWTRGPKTPQTMHAFKGKLKQKNIGRKIKTNYTISVILTHTKYCGELMIRFGDSAVI